MLRSMQNIKIFIYKNRFLTFVIFLLLGFLLRYYLLRFAFINIYYDMQDYHNAALTFLTGHLAADCCQKNAGYSMFLSIVYYFFGSDNLVAFQVIQIIIDLLTGVLLFKIAGYIFSKTAAYLSFIIYIFNPLTSTYTGIRLPETVTIFLITIIVSLISLPSFKHKFIYWLFLGELLGMLLLTRKQFYYFIFLYILLSALGINKIKNKLIYLTLTLAGFLIISSYSLYSYYITYQTVSLVPPYTNFYHDLYMNFYGNFRYPELLDNSANIDPTYEYLGHEYFTIPLTGKRKYDLEYKDKFFQRLKTDWPEFAKQVLRNIFWMWDKDHLSVYKDIFYPYDIWPIRIYNIVLLVCFLAGVFFYIRKKGIGAFQKPIVQFTIILFLYITLTFTLVSNETRHSMIFYSLIILWAGYGISQLFKV
jgi:hypothetical protein